MIFSKMGWRTRANPSGPRGHATATEDGLVVKEEVGLRAV